MDTDSTITLRPATPEDTEIMAKLMDIAGEGIPRHLWSGIAAVDQTPLEVGAERARRETGSFSYRNATMADVDRETVGMMLGYVIAESTDEDRAAVHDLPAPVRPFVELEHRAAGTFYVNALAVLPGRRGNGAGSRLLQAAEASARDRGVRQMSIQVFAQNAGAVRLYHRQGYRDAAESRVLLHPCHPYYDGMVLLLLKDL